jgi:hypothetical protein
VRGYGLSLGPNPSSESLRDSTSPYGRGKRKPPTDRFNVKTIPRQVCICIRDDITSVLSACVGFDPMPPPTPLVVFCIY